MSNQPDSQPIEDTVYSLFHDQQEKFRARALEVFLYGVPEAERENWRGRVEGVDFDADTFVIRYNGACHCHPETSYEEHPAELLWRENWMQVYDERKAEQERADQAAKTAKDASNEQRSREARQALYEELRREFEPTP